MKYKSPPTSRFKKISFLKRISTGAVHLLSGGVLILLVSTSPRVQGDSDKISDWLSDLRSPNASVRIRAAYSYSRLEPRTRATALSLIEGLKDKDPYVRRYCASALGELDVAPELVIPALSRTLSDPDQRVREHAAVALARIGAPAVPSLIENLRNSGFSAWAQFSFSQSELPRPSSQRAEVVNLRDYAAFALIETGPPAVPLLMQVSANKDVRAGRWVDIILSAIAENNESQLRFFLRNPDPNLSLWAALRLYEERFHARPYNDSSDPDWAQILLVFKQALEGSDKLRCLKVLRKLFLGADEAAGLVPALIKLLNDSDDEVRAETVSALGFIGRNVDYGNDKLIRLASDPSPSVRKNVFVALGMIGRRNPIAIEPILNGLEDSNEEVQDGAIYALSSIGGNPKIGAPAVAKIIRTRFGRNEKIDSYDIILIFRRLGDEAYPVLLDLLNDNDEGVREFTLKILQDLVPQNDRVTAAVLRRLQDPSKAVRIRAAHLLTYIADDNSGIDALIELSGDPDPVVRRKAIASLGEGFVPKRNRAHEAIIQATNDAHPAVRSIALEILSVLRDQSPAFLEALVKSLSDRDADVRISAAHAIALLGDSARERIAREALTVLLRAIDSASGNEWQAEESAAFLVALENFGAKAVPILAKLVTSDSAAIANEATKELATNSLYSEDVSLEVIKLLNDSREHVRLRAVVIAGQSVALSPPVIMALSKLLSDPSIRIRLAVLAILLRQRRESLIPLEPDVENLQKNNESAVRIAALCLILKINGNKASAVRGLSKELDFPYTRPDKNAFIRRQKSPIVRAFSEVGTEAVPTLIASLTNGNVTVRRNSSAALLNLGLLARTAIPALTLSLRDSDVDVRLNAARAIEGFGPEAEGAAYLLVPLLEDADEEVRQAAADALFATDAELTEAGPAFNTAIIDEFFEKTLHDRLRTIADDLTGTDHATYEGSTAALAEKADVANALPQLPWPPPRYSDFCVLPRSSLGLETDNLERVNARIIAELQAAGYDTRVFFAIPGGFAIVTRLERINDDGTSYFLPYRWTREKIPPVSLKGYLSALLFESPGQFRLFVFAISSLDNIPSSSESLTEEDAADLAGRGGGILPKEIAKMPFHGRNCQVLVYRFQKNFGQGAKIQYSDPLGLSAERHLRSAGLSRLLQR